MKTRKLCAAGTGILLLLAWLLAACRPIPETPIQLTPTTTTGPEACIEFEDLAVGTTFTVPDGFTSSGYEIQTQNFVWTNGTPAPSGHAEVLAGGASGGTGNEMNLNNISLEFKFERPMSYVKMLFGEYGDNLNIEINGDFVNFENFVDIDGTTIGGVAVSVPNGGLGNDMGAMELSGPIEYFTLGGQELYIDHICPTE